VVGGGMMGVETAAFLKGRGKDVILVSLQGEEQLGFGMESRLRHWFLNTFWPEMRIPFYSHKKWVEVTDEGLVVKDEKRGGQVTLLEGKTVVFCLGVKADSKFNAFMNSLPAEEIHKIGDCLRPRNILEAIHGGYTVAKGI
jgi:pyruvate/2-oxoglutarate dehydrogenase complex dihydrolipoamide dehydrogenase (E3) component